MIGAWNQFGWDGIAPNPPGDETTYRMAEEFLTGLAVEDWGCGPGWFKTIHQGPCIGVDGTKTQAVDIVADLVTYRSQAEGILLRHVVEHNNLWWQRILTNALESFRRRFTLVLFTPFSNYTDVLGWSGVFPRIPDLSFRREDIVSCFDGYTFRSVENLKTKTQYGVEHVFLLERR